MEVPLGADRQTSQKKENWPHKTKGCSAFDFERVLQRKFSVQLSSINVKVASLVINSSQTKFMYLYLYFSPQTHMNTKSISTVLTLSAQNELCCCVFSVFTITLKMNLQIMWYSVSKRLTVEGIFSSISQHNCWMHHMIYEHRFVSSDDCIVYIWYKLHWIFLCTYLHVSNNMEYLDAAGFF